MMISTLSRAALAAALALATVACAGADMEPNEDIHGYEYDDRGKPLAAYVFAGWDERNCAQYRLAPLHDDVAAVDAMFVWDGERFTTNQDRCKPGQVAR